MRLRFQGGAIECTDDVCDFARFELEDVIAGTAFHHIWCLVQILLVELVIAITADESLVLLHGNRWKRGYFDVFGDDSLLAFMT